MKSKQDTLAEIRHTGVVAVIRMTDHQRLMNVVHAVRDGGVTCIEITMTTPNAVQMIEKTADSIGDQSTIGAGTVLDPETARAVILAGAEFVVATTLNLKVIELCQRYSVAVVPGAFTPTEILTAWEAGADIVKLFPATALGPQYIKDVRAPLPQVEIIPTGGVNVDNAGDFIKAGACAVAVGSALLNKKAIVEERYSKLTDLAKQLTANVQQARA